MKEEQNLKQIAKYLSDNSDSKEREELFAWVKEDPANKELLEESMEVWEASEPSELAFQPNMDTAWGRMDERLNQARTANDADYLGENTEAIIRPIPFFQPWMRIAAAAVVLLGISLWIFQSNPNENWVKKQTIAEEKTMIDLPDGSKIWLNQSSTLKYQKLFDKRLVYLEGEAFFEVAKMDDKPFEIYAGASKTRVLGTAFNVRAYPEEKKVEITVEEGKVAFSAKEKPIEKELLIAGDHATYTKSSQEIEKLNFTKLNAAAWKKGALRFSDSQLEEVIESLERYYDIEIEVENNKIYNCIWINTKTYEKPVLEELIKLLEFTNGLTIRKEGKQTFIFDGEGCE